MTVRMFKPFRHSLSIIILLTTSVVIAQRSKLLIIDYGTPEGSLIQETYDRLEDEGKLGTCEADRDLDRVLKLYVKNHLNKARKLNPKYFEIETRSGNMETVIIDCHNEDKMDVLNKVLIILLGTAVIVGVLVFIVKKFRREEFYAV